MKPLVFLGLLTSLLSVGNAKSLDTLIAEALDTHPSLQVFESRASAMEKQQEMDGKLANPMLNIGINDIRLDAPGRYHLEPMQSQYIRISQTFPINGELALKSQKTAIGTQAVHNSLLITQANLVSQVKKLSFQIVANEQMTGVQQRFGRTIEQMGELHTAYGETGTDHHLMLIRSDISKSENELRLVGLQNEKERLLSELGELVGSPVDTVELALEPTPLESEASYQNQALQNHPGITKLRTLKRQTEISRELAEAQSIPDITIGLGYYYRDAYEDYASFSAGIPLPVYGRERAQVEREQFNVQAAQSAILDLERQVRSQVATTWQNAQESKQRLTLIEEMLKQNNQAIEVISGQIESGRTHPEQLLRTANEQLKIEQMLITEKVKFHLALSELERLRGALK